jgi:hypothetical protein
LKASALPSSALHVLPPSATDILGRPILILRLADLANLQKDPREHILRTVEGLRIKLHSINPSSPPGSPMPGPVLQYVLLVDMKSASLRNFVRLVGQPVFISDYFPPPTDRFRAQNLDLLTWYIHEVAPRYPGMFGTGMFFPAACFCYLATSNATNAARSLRHQLLLDAVRHLDHHQVRIPPPPPPLSPDCSTREPLPRP